MVEATLRMVDPNAALYSSSRVAPHDPVIDTKEPFGFIELADYLEPVSSRHVLIGR
jgi:hypothetical protein